MSVVPGPATSPPADVSLKKELPLRMRLVTLVAVAAAAVGVASSIAGVITLASGASHGSTGTHVEAGRSNTGNGHGGGY